MRTLDDYCRHSWLLGMEAWETIRSYSLEAEHVLRLAVAEAGPRVLLRHHLPYEVFFSNVPTTHIAFFRRLQLLACTPDCVCAHAGVSTTPQPFEDQNRSEFVWGMDRFPGEYSGEMTVVYGHFNNGIIAGDGRPMPRVIGRTIGIDTIAHGVLTAVRLPGCDVLQAGARTRGGQP